MGERFVLDSMLRQILHSIAVPSWPLFPHSHVRRIWRTKWRTIGTCDEEKGQKSKLLDSSLASIETARCWHNAQPPPPVQLPECLVWERRMANVSYSCCDLVLRSRDNHQRVSHTKDSQDIKMTQGLSHSRAYRQSVD